MGLRPEDVDLAGDSVPAADGVTLVAEVVVVEPLGREDLVGVTINGVETRVLVDKARGVRIGDTISIVLDMSKIQFFDPETEQSLLWA
jgi:ABC-type sugar transport system ATPase subunit